MQTERRLTDRQLRETYLAIKGYIDAVGYPPTSRELGVALGLTSSSSAHARLEWLEREGWIRREPGKPRAIRLTKD